MECTSVLKDTVYERCCILQGNANTEEKKWRVGTIFMVVVNIILLVSILGVTITWRMERGRESTNIKQEAEMCLPCDDLYRSADEVSDNEKGFEKRMDGDKETCCGRASEHLDQLVTLYTEKVHKKERNLKMQIANYYKCNGSSQSVKIPSAHLVGVTKSVQDMHHHHTLKWNESCHLSHINGVVYNDGKFYVKTSGFYYIYSQIIYQDHGDSSSYTENNIVLHHSIHKEYNGDDITREKLLESTQSRCQIVGNRGNLTSYLGAVFYLKENEHIHVRVSHPHKIIPSKHVNYFGMYLT